MKTTIKFNHMTAIDVDKSSDNERYAYLIQQIVESGMVWLLQASDGMFAMFEDPSGNEYIPVWPHEDSTMKYISDDWEDYTATSMNLKEFLSWLEELENDQIIIGAFPKDNMQVIPIQPIEMKSHLKDASKKF